LKFYKNIFVILQIVNFTKILNKINSPLPWWERGRGEGGIKTGNPLPPPTIFNPSSAGRLLPGLFAIGFKIIENSLNSIG
jgi:hypothetical protein